MKLLVTGDIHYALKQFDWLLSVAEHHDAVVIVGDLLEISSAVDLEAQIVVVRTYLRRLARRTRVVVCSGNHDLNALSPGGERVPDWLEELEALEIAVDGARTRIGDATVSVFPWWDGPEAKAAIAEQLAREAADRPERWIWAYHAPPGDSPTSWGGSRHFGDPALSAWIAEYRPDAVLCGHVHQAPFVQGGAWADRIGSTWVFNMGQQPGEIPSHIILDTEGLRAFWYSIAGPEELDLAAAEPRPVAVAGLPDWVRA